jgi:hypothetical protein
LGAWNRHPKRETAALWAVMMIKPADSSEKLVHTFQTTRRHMPEKHHLHNHCRENFKSYIFSIIKNKLMVSRGSIPGHVMWDLWWTKCYWDEFTPSIKSIFWDMTPCSPLSFNRRFGGAYRLHVQGKKNSKPASKLVCWTYYFDPEDGGDVPPKLRLKLNGLHGVISQKMILFTTTVVKTSNLTPSSSVSPANSHSTNCPVFINNHIIDTGSIVK